MIGCMHRVAPLPALLMALAVGGCAVPGECPAGYGAAVLAEAYFGRGVAGREPVSDAEWAAFAAAELTPRFPEGMSVADIAGQWRGQDGAIVREPTKRVGIVLSDPDRQRPLLQQAAESYRTTFSQDSVLLVETAACARF